MYPDLEGKGGLTGVSIHVLNCVSSAWQPATLYPAEAQHAVRILALFQGSEEGSLLRTEVIIARQGLASPWFGRRIRSLWRGGRRIGCSFVEAPLGGIVSLVVM
jgi:hypothetical protein